MLKDKLHTQAYDGFYGKWIASVYALLNWKFCITEVKRIPVSQSLWRAKQQPR